MTANIYNNLFTAVFQPIRYLKLRGAVASSVKAPSSTSCEPEPLKRAA
jgi:hypothetical protein